MYIYIGTHTHIYIHVYKYTYIYICIYIYMFVCTYIYKNTNIYNSPAQKSPSKIGFGVKKQDLGT